MLFFRINHAATVMRFGIIGFVVQRSSYKVSKIVIRSNQINKRGDNMENYRIKHVW